MMALVKENNQIITKKEDLDKYTPIWIHFNNQLDLEIVQKYVSLDFELFEDLVETQRPRFTTYENFNVLILEYPTKSFFSTRDTIQIGFILMKDLIITVSNKESYIIKNLFKKLRAVKSLEKGDILSEIIDNFTEETIDLIEMYDDLIDEISKIILSEQYKKDLIYKIILIKTNQHYLNRILNANRDAISKLLIYEDIDDTHFEKNIKNRLLYALDINATIKEELDNLMSLYVSFLSNKMNEKINLLTILATAFMLPTLISGFFGMNVNVPNWDFFTIVGGSIMLSLFFAWILYKFINFQ